VDFPLPPFLFPLSGVTGLIVGRPPLSPSPFPSDEVDIHVYRTASRHFFFRPDSAAALWFPLDFFLPPRSRQSCGETGGWSFFSPVDLQDFWSFFLLKRRRPGVPCGGPLYFLLSVFIEHWSVPLFFFYGSEKRCLIRFFYFRLFLGLSSPLFPVSSILSWYDSGCVAPIGQSAAIFLSFFFIPSFSPLSATSSLFFAPPPNYTVIYAQRCRCFSFFFFFFSNLSGLIAGRFFLF